MNKQAADALANWLLHVHPEIFTAIAKKTIPHTAALSGVSDVLSSLGTDLSTAVSSVGSWVANPQNFQNLTGAATAYFNSQAPSVANAQNAVFQTQLQRAQAGLSPAPITYAVNAQGQTYPVYNGNTLSPNTLQTLAPSFMQKYGLWLAFGGGALALIFILKR